MTGCGLWMNYDELKGNSIYTIGIYWEYWEYWDALTFILHYFTVFHILHYCTFWYNLIHLRLSLLTSSQVRIIPKSHPPWSRSRWPCWIVRRFWAWRHLAKQFRSWFQIASIKIIKMRNSTYSTILYTYSTYSTFFFLLLIKIGEARGPEMVSTPYEMNSYNSWRAWGTTVILWSTALVELHYSKPDQVVASIDARGAG